MRPELPVLSFFCLVLLVALTLLHVNSRNVAVLALIGWLLVCSLVQGVDSVVWANDSAVRSPGWCDLATKVVFGARLAIPAACTSICYHLYFLSSNRDAKRRPYRSLFEVIFCLIFPIVYMILHIIVQNHRFDVAQGFGCVASIYTSDAAIILVWIPPFAFSIAALVFAGLSLRCHIRRSRQLSDRVCLSSRLITVTFLRPLFTSMAISLLVFLVSLYDMVTAMTSDGGLQPWHSWHSVHENLSQPEVIPDAARAYRHRIEAWWWVPPLATLLFAGTALAGLAYCAQTERNGRRPGHWFRTSLFRRSRGDDEFIQRDDGYGARFSSRLSTRLSTRFTVSPGPRSPLVSGWDDTFRSKPRAPTSPAPSDVSSADCATPVKPAGIVYPMYPAPPPPPRAHLPTPLVIPPPPPSLPACVVKPAPKPSPPKEQASPRWSTLLTHTPPSLHPLAQTPPSMHPLGTSPAESLLSSPWPCPPSSVPLSPVSPAEALLAVQQPSPPDASPLAPRVPPALFITPPPPAAPASPGPSLSPMSPAPSRRYARPPSTGSLAESTISANAYLPDARRAPFADAGIPAPPSDASPLVERSRSPLRRIPSLEGFHARKRSLGPGAPRRREQEAIYMTVVHETA